MYLPKLFKNKMETPLTIEVACQGATTVPLEELHNLQGELKTLSETDYVKLRNSIIELGFSFPIFFWADDTGKKWIIDAHQRTNTLRKMQEEGYTIPLLPADPIFAKNKTEAKKKLLVLNSRYGKVTDTGLADFLNEEDSEIAIEDMGDLLTFPEMGFDYDEPTTGGGSETDTTPQKVICPNCQTVITI